MTMTKRAILALGHRGPNYGLAARIAAVGVDTITDLYGDAQEAKRLTDPSRGSKVGAHDVLVGALAIYDAVNDALLEAAYERMDIAEVEAQREAETEGRKWGHYVNYRRPNGKHGNSRVKTEHLRPSQVEAYLRAHCEERGWEFISVGMSCKKK